MLRNVITREQEVVLDKNISAILSEEKISPANQLKINKAIKDLINCVLQTPTAFQPYILEINNQLMSAGLSEEKAYEIGDKILQLPVLNQISDTFEEKPIKTTSLHQDDAANLEVTVKKILAEEKIPEEKHASIVQTIKEFFIAGITHKNHLNLALISEIFSDLTVGLKKAGCNELQLKNINKKLSGSEICTRVLSDFFKEMSKINSIMKAYATYSFIFKTTLDVFEETAEIIDKLENCMRLVMDAPTKLELEKKLIFLDKTLKEQLTFLEEMRGKLSELIIKHPNLFPIKDKSILARISLFKAEEFKPLPDNKPLSDNEKSPTQPPSPK